MPLSVFSTHSFYLSSQLFFLCCIMHDEHFETNEKISNRIDESNTTFYNTIHRLVWLVGWIHFLFSGLFSGENCVWSPCFLFITAWLTLNTSDETTSWINCVCSLVFETSLFADGGSVGSYIGTGQVTTKTFVKYKSATADKFITRKQVSSVECWDHCGKMKSIS